MHQPMQLGAPGALRVVRVDIDADLPDISPYRDGRGDGPAYVGARVIAVRGGRPVGELDLDLRAGPVPASRLRRELASRLSDPVGENSQAPDVAAESLPAATVVLCSTFARSQSLRACVETVLAQEYSRFDVVVVDNRPHLAAAPEHAQAREWLSERPRVRLVDQPRQGLSAARNAGAAASTGEIIVFIDDDCLMESGWLRAIGARFVRQPETDCVTGPILPLELEHPAQRWFEGSGAKLTNTFVATTFRRPAGASGRRRFVVRADTHGRRAGREVFIYRGVFGSGAMIAIRARALTELGGFDEALGAGVPSGGGEDLQLLARVLFAGRQLTYEPGAAIYHAHRTDFEDLRRTMVTYGSGYTAMLASLVRADPRHLLGLAHYGVHAVSVAVRRRARRRGENYPAALARAERRGMLLGPWAYVRSRRWLRRQGVA